MLQVLYLAFCLFMIHSALMSGSAVFAAFAILLILVPVCFFVMLLVQRKLTKVTLELEGEKLLLLIDKRGHLPISGMKYTLCFSYDQSGERAQIKNTVAVPKGHTEIVFYPELLYAGSGVFELKKCKISDYFGFFSVKLQRKPQTIPIELMPADSPVMLEPAGDPGQNYISEYTKTVQKKGDDSSETFDIREYQAGDRISRMHWKLSAKRGTPMIREFSREDNARYLFLLALRERTQDEFHRVITNYWNLVQGLPEEENGHVLVFEDPKGEITEIGVEDASQLENAVLSAFQAFSADSDPSLTQEGNTARFSPHEPEEILDEYHQIYSGRRFIREFTVTDEDLKVLQKRWDEDEDF